MFCVAVILFCGCFLPGCVFDLFVYSGGLWFTYCRWFVATYVGFTCWVVYDWRWIGVMWCVLAWCGY